MPEAVQKPDEQAASRAWRAVARAVADAVSPSIFDLTGWEVATDRVVLRGSFVAGADRVRQHVAQVARGVLGREPKVTIHHAGSGQPFVLVLDEDVERALIAAPQPRRPMLSLALFLATFVTTAIAGAAHQGLNLLERPGAWTAGLPYAVGVVTILGVHEMGHFLAARWHRVPVSLPYFIPVPFGLGTFGAFIRMPPLMGNRRQLFDIGLAGPLAGLVVAIPALVVGLKWSSLLPAEAPGDAHMTHGVSVNASILLALISKLALGGALAKGHYLVLHPVAFAGWLGLMLTALNLLPVGQLDGGHVTHALVGHVRAGAIGKAALAAMTVLGLFVWSGLLLWVLLVWFVAGRSGLPPADDLTPVEGRRRALGWCTLVLPVLTLLPFPHALSPYLGLHCPYL